MDNKENSLRNLNPGFNSRADINSKSDKFDVRLINCPSGSDLGLINPRVDTFGGSIVEGGDSSESSPERSLP